MNIFYVHEDPRISARSLADPHVCKMILETAQLLATAHRFLDGKEVVCTKIGSNGKPYKFKSWVLEGQRDSEIPKSTHVGNRCSIWARESIHNYLWLFEHFGGLLEEYTFRYGKEHSYHKLLYLLNEPPKNIPDIPSTPAVMAMDDKFVISKDPVTNYKNYYNLGKRHLHKWKIPQRRPDWIINNI